jgi:hypothetical protein
MPTCCTRSVPDMSKPVRSGHHGIASMLNGSRPEKEVPVEMRLVMLLPGNQKRALFQCPECMKVVVKPVTITR